MPPAVAVVTSSVTVCPVDIVTMSPDDGITPPNQVVESDQGPSCALDIACILDGKMKKEQTRRMVCTE